jgi:outer membrane protein OmpA-like peptidoglycan-associated protein
MPGQEPAGGTIRLHPIRHHAAKPDAASETDTNNSPPVATKEVSGPASGKASHVRSEPGKPVIPFNFGEDDGSAQAPAAPQPSLKTASIPPHPASSPHGPNDEHAGLSKRGAVMFEKGATNPSAAQFTGVKLLATDLATALESGATRVQLEAYGGAPGDKSSDARRLSLKRALAVRQLLIDGGVPSNRIDVRAMGGVDDKGPADRVDVFVRAG